MDNYEIQYKSKELYFFFIITFIISWTNWIIAPFIAGGDQVSLSSICLLGAFGPSLSAMLLNWKQNSYRLVKVTKRRIITFLAIFISSFILSLFLMFLNLVYTLNIISVIAFILSSFIAGLIISGKYSNNTNMKFLLDKVNGVKGKNIHLMTAFFIPILTSIGGFLIYVVIGGPIPADFNFLLVFLGTSISYPFIFFFGGPLNEEPGWRGFATPRLQKRFNPLVTGLIIGIIWSLWHGPLHFNGFYGDGLPGFLFRFVFNIPLGILFTWYYNKSEGNLLGCILLHASVNVYLNLFASITLALLFGMIILIGFSLILIIINKMWKE